MKRSLLLSVLVASASLSALPVLAQTGDAPPVDVASLLQALKQLRDQNDAGLRARRNQAYQQVVAALASPEKAVAFWKEAVKGAQFEGAEHEASKISDWREGDGEALNDKLCQGAVVLHLRWLALSLQHAMGTETKQLLPQVIEYTKALQADDFASDHFNDQLDKARERNDGKHGMKKNTNEDALVKRVHDQILRTSIGNSPVAKWKQWGELLDGGGKRPKQGSAPNGWESVPGNWDGIYAAVILPQFRANRDPRLLDYWDLVIKRETDQAADRKLEVEQRDWQQVKLPGLQWNRAQDVLLLGYKNRAIGLMFNLVKTYPQHPEAQNWISQIETILLGGAASTGSPDDFSPAAPSAPARPGTVPAPAPIPSPATVPAPAATAPRPTAPIPQATLVPTPSAPGTVPRR